MTRFESPQKTIEAPLPETCRFLSDMEKFGTLLPPQVTNWSCDGKECRFTIQGMAEIALLQEKVSDEEIIYKSLPPTPVEMTLSFHLTPDDSKTGLIVRLDAALNPMLKMMVSRPLENLVTLMSEAVAREMEKKPKG